MKRIFKSALSFLLVAVMVLGAAPLSGFVGLELPEFGGIDLPEFRGLDKIKIAVSDFFDGFSLKAEATEYEDGYFRYTVANNEATITEYIGWDSIMTIPESLGEYPVTSIGENAFGGNENICFIRFEGSKNKLDIGDGAFSHCINLEEFDIIGRPLGDIGNHAFEACWKLRTVMYFESVTERIGNCAFQDCYELERFEIPISLKTLGDYAFVNCGKITYFYFGQNSQITTIGKYAIPVSVTTIYFSDNCQLARIEDECFLGYNELSYVYFGENSNLQSIGKKAFQGTGLTSIFIPRSVISIEEGAFSACHNFSGITFEEGSKLEKISSYLFEGCNSLSWINLPDGITSIGDYAFFGCSLKKINIPDSVKSIGDYAFFSAFSDDLNSVYVPDGVEYVSPTTFSGNNKILYVPDNVASEEHKIDRTFVIPDGVTAVEDHTYKDFYDNVEKIYIPKSVINIEKDLFSTLHIYYQGTEDEWQNNSLKDVLRGYSIYYNCDYVDSITINHPNEQISMLVGDVTTFEAYTLPKSATFSDVEWFSSNPYVAEVDSNGVVTAVSDGTAKIVAKAAGAVSSEVKDVITITVSKRPRGIPSPQLISSTGVSCCISQVNPSEGNGNVRYGWSLQNDVSTVNNWDSATCFFDLSSDTKYYFFAKVTGDPTYADAYSAALEVNLSNIPITGTVSLKKNGATVTSAVFGETLTAEINVEGDYVFSWYRGTELIRGANSTSYTLGLDDIDSVISVSVKGTEANGYTGTITSNFVSVTKKSVVTPSAPILYEATGNSITIVKKGYQKYKIDNGDWIYPKWETYTFKGLYEGELYNIYTYIPEEDGCFASEISSPISVIVALTYPIDDICLDKQGVRYSLDSSTKTAAVTSSTATLSKAEIIIPQYVWKDGVQYRVTSISENAFSGCTKIETVTFSDTVTTIGTKAFYGCSNLIAAYFDGAAPSSFGGNAFDSANKDFLIYYYPTQAGWKNSVVLGKYNGYYAVLRNAIEEVKGGSIDRSVHIIRVTDTSGNVLSGATVNFNGVIQRSDENGFTYFENPNVSSVPLTVSFKGYKDYIKKDYVPVERIRFGCIQLSDDPSRVDKGTCNGEDIIIGTAQINCALNLEEAEIILEGYSQYDILKYEIVQEGKVLAESKNGKFIIPNDHFIDKQQVVAVIYSSDGKVVSQVLNITVVRYEFASSLPFSLGSENKITIPKSVLPFGELTLGFDLEKFPVTYEVTNYSMRLGVNMDVKKKTIGELEDEVERQRELNSQPTAKLTFKVGAGGYLDAKISKDGVRIVERNGFIWATIGFTVGNTFWLGVVPIRVDFSVNAKGEVAMALAFDFENTKWEKTDIDLTLSLNANLHAGVGTRIASAGIFGDATIRADFRLLPETYTKKATLSGKTGLYAKGGVIFKWRIEYIIFQGEKVLYQKPISKSPSQPASLRSAIPQVFNLLSAVYNEENYQFVDRDYLETRSGWLSAEETENTTTFSARSLLANSVSSNSVSSNNNTLQTSVFSNIEPEIITCGETTMMIYSDDNGGDDEYNNMELVYSIYDEASDTWSVPVRVGGVDFNEGISDVYTDGKDIYIAYIQTNRMFTAEDKMSDYAAASEIAVTKFDFENGTFEEPVIITDNDTADMMPVFAVVDSVPCVVWINNKDNDSFAMTANNSLCYSSFKNGAWSEPVELIGASSTITSSAIGKLGSKAYIAITRDVDCNLETNNDRYVSLVDFEGNVIDIATEGNNNEYINYVTENGVNKFVWLCDGNLMSITGADSEVTQILETPVPALSGGYQLVENNKGGFDILFTEAVGDGSEVYGMFYDEGWCLPVKVTRTETDRYVESYAATYIGDRLLIPYLSTAVTFINEKMETSADLCCTTVEFKSDLKTENAEIDYDNLMEEPEVSTFSLRRSAKTATVNLKVSNNGLSKVESVTVSIPELSYSQSQSVTIMPGETKEISAVFNLPDDITADDLTVTVSPTGSDDMDSTDNSASFKIGYTDFSVAAEQRILGNQDYILVGVTNSGNIAGNAVLKVIKDNLDGETLYELAIENLGIGETRYYMIETDSGFFDENSDCGLITVYAETDTLEEIDYNNYEFVVLNHFNREIVDTENLVPNSSIGATSAVFDKYAPQNITVEIDANGNTFEGISKLSTDNYTVGENVTISKSYLSTLEVGSYDFIFVFRSSETQTQERVFTVVVEDSSPVAPEISGEQISVSVYDGNAIEEDVDFAVYTNSDGAVTFSYSSDNGVTWTSGLPVLAGTYLIKADVAATEEYVASSAQFTVTISKAGRAIPSPAAITVTNSSVSLATVIPTVFESEDTVYYGYSSTNDASTINNWSLNPVFDGLNANTEYYFFAKVSCSNNYEDAISVATSVKTSKNSVNAPEAPVLESKTDTSVTLVSADGYEYRCNDGEWQSKNTFEGLKPNQSYSFTQRIAETENSYASAPSAALVVTTDKSVTQAPEAPDIEGKTDTTVTLSHTNGYEYRCNDGVWTDSNIFTGLDRNTEYSFYQRVSETDISYASESSEALTVITDKTELSGTVVINGIAQTAENLTADVSAVKPAEAQFTYQWYSDGNAISGETSAEYTVTYNDLGHEVSVEVTGINDFKGTLISVAVIPVAASANGIVSIEGDPVYGNDLTATVTELNPSYAEYAMQWYRGDTPIGGATKEKYTVAKEDIGQQITVRITGVNGYDISVLSAGVIPVKQTVDAPQAPKAETVTSDSITLVSNDGYEYRIGNGEWQSDNVFTSDSNGNALMPDTEYAFSQRVKETETAFASAESEIAVIRTKPIRVESISISESNVEMIKTYSYQLSASVSPENATDKNIIWLSSDESVATVDQNGFVTAIESGNTVITAKSADGGFTASCVITVVPDTYTVIWNVNGEKTTHEVRYSEYITAPQNPVADGYEFIGWTPEIPQTMPLYDLEFTAVFEPIEYYAEFVADGVTVSRVPYNVETDSINAPVVPNKIGYSGKWENYELTIGGITVNAIYTVNAYKVTWVVDGEETQMSANYGESIDKSFVPQKDGYKFMGWTPDVPQTMPARDLTFTAVFEKSYICPDCGDEVLGEDAINNHIASEARMKATVKIKNNSGSKTIKYGETLRLTAITTNMPTDARVYWYIDGIMQGEGETFNVSFENGTKTVEVKIVDSNGNVLKNASENEIFDSEEVTVKGGFFQKIISFFKNLFRMNRTIIQSVFKGTF